MGFTVTLERNFPLAGVIVCVDFVGVADFVSVWIAPTVTEVRYFPVVGVIICSLVPGVTSFVSVSIALTVT